MKVIVNSVSIKWREGDIVKVKEFKTQEELNIFRHELEKNPSFKLIGESRNVTYPVGYDCYAEI